MLFKPQQKDELATLEYQRSQLKPLVNLGETTQTQKYLALQQQKSRPGVPISYTELQWNFPDNVLQEDISYRNRMCTRQQKLLSICLHFSDRNTCQLQALLLSNSALSSQLICSQSNLQSLYQLLHIMTTAQASTTQDKAFLIVFVKIHIFFRGMHNPKSPMLVK